MTRINNPQTLRKVGMPTPRTVIYKSESHKLHQAFAAKKNDGQVVTIVPGMPVKLNADGTIEAYTGSGVYLGIAVTDSKNPCYPDGALGPEVTVMVEGYAVVYALADLGSDAQADDTLACGEVVPGTLDDDSLYVPYAAPAQAAASTHPKFINITPGATDGELIQVVIR